MRVKELMKRDVTTITAGDSAADAMERMRKNRIRHLVVIDGRKIVGVLADRDLIGRNDRELPALRVSDVMTADPATIEPEDLISRAANRMRGRGIGCLPVVEEGRLVGILTTTDLLEALTHTAQAERRTMRDKRAASMSSEKQPASSQVPSRAAAPPVTSPRAVRFARKQRRAAPPVSRPR